MGRKKPTLKQAKFVGKYVKDGNATKAVREAYPNIQTDGARRVMGHKLVTNVNVQAHIQEIMDREGLTPELVVRELKTLITDEDKGIKTRAIRIACEVMGLVGSGGILQQININEGEAQLSTISAEGKTQAELWAMTRRLLGNE